MALTTAQLETNLDFIFTSLASTDAVETLTVAGDDTEYDAVRGMTLSAEELRETGWAEDYKQSFYLKRSTAPTLSLKQKVTLSTAGVLRILNISEGPARTYIRIDVGDPNGTRAR